MPFVAQGVGVLERLVRDGLQLGDPGQRMLVPAVQLVPVVGGVGDHVLHPTHQPDRRRVHPGEVPGLDAPTAPRHAEFHPGDGTSIDALTAAADTAMYTAKTAGRDCVRYAENSINPTR